MRKFFGIIIIICSVLLGFACAIVLPDDVIIATMIFWIISVPLYIMGQIIRTSKYEFKNRGKRWVSLYTYFFFILPLLIFLYGYFDDLKKNKLADEKFIIYESSSGLLGELSVGFLVLLIFLFAARFLNPGLKRKGLLNITIMVTVIFSIGFNYLMFNDYRGIHEEKGLVSSNWKSESNIISYEEIESVKLEPYVHYAKLSNTSDETRFVWKLTFYPRNQKSEVVYHFRMMTETNLEQTAAIKKLAMGKDIHFVTEEMSQETLKWFDFDLKLEELDKDRYYELFQLHNK